jgi:hypothetical protein
MYVLGCKLSGFRLCDSDFGITPVADITIGITPTAFCFHIAHISFARYYYYYYYYYVCLACVITNLLDFFLAAFVHFLSTLLTALLWTRLLPANGTVQYETKCHFVGKSTPLALNSPYTPRCCTWHQYFVHVYRFPFPHTTAFRKPGLSYVVSGFRSGVNQICALQGCYAEQE